MFEVGGRGAADRGPYSLQVSAYDTLAGDSACAPLGAVGVSGMTNTIVGDTTYASADGYNSSCVFGNDLFYTLGQIGFPPVNFLVTVTGSGWQPIVGTYSGFCNDLQRGSCASLTASGYRLAIRGQPVSLVLGGRTAADRGRFTMNVLAVPPPAGEACSSAVDYSGTATTPMAGDTTNMVRDDTGACASAAPGDLFVRVTLGSVRNVTATVTATSWQPTVALRNGSCTGAQIACGNLAASSNRAASQLPAGTHYVVVGGRTASDFGPFSLLVTATPP